MADNLKQKTAQGLFWGALNSGTTQVLNLIIGIFLARLLTPADYGIVGVLSIFTLIAGNLQSSGFSQALINLKEPTANDYNSVYWFNVLASIAIYALLFLAAPLIALYFRQPCLTAVSRFVFLGFVISSLGIARNAYMTKNMMNREIAIVSFAALVASGTVGIILALHHLAYWSLAWQQIVYITVLNLGRFYYVRWRPSLHIDFGPVRRMLPFSIKMLITNIINTLSSNVLTFIFGRLYTIRAVGNFTQALKWETMAYTFVANTVGQVAQPVLAAIRGEQEREVRVFRKMLRFTAFLSFPAMLGLAMVSREFILLTISAKWADCIPLMQVLCVGGAFMPLYTLYQNVAISNGRSDVYMWLNLAQLAAQVTIVVAFHRQGILAMVGIYTLFTIIWLAVWQHQAHRIIGVRWADVMRDILPSLLIAATVMTVTYVVTLPIATKPLLLGTRILLAAGLYALACRMLRLEMMDECIRFVRRRKA